MLDSFPPLATTLTHYAVFRLGPDFAKVRGEFCSYREARHWLDQFAGSAEASEETFAVLYDV